MGACKAPRQPSEASLARRAVLSSSRERERATLSAERLCPGDQASCPSPARRTRYAVKAWWRRVGRLIRLPGGFPGRPVFARLPPVFRPSFAPNGSQPYPAVAKIGTSQALSGKTPFSTTAGMDAGGCYRASFAHVENGVFPERFALSPASRDERPKAGFRWPKRGTSAVPVKSRPFAAQTERSEVRAKWSEAAIGRPRRAFRHTCCVTRSGRLPGVFRASSGRLSDAPGNRREGEARRHEPESAGREPERSESEPRRAEGRRRRA